MDHGSFLHERYSGLMEAADVGEWNSSGSRASYVDRLHIPDCLGDIVTGLTTRTCVCVCVCICRVYDPGKYRNRYIILSISVDVQDTLMKCFSHPEARTP